MIYFMQVANNGPVKIGFTKDIWARFASLSTALYEPIELVAVCEGTRLEEAALHSKFAAHRIKHEWFRPAHEVLDYAKAVHVGFPPKPEARPVGSPVLHAKKAARLAAEQSSKPPTSHTRGAA